MTAVALLALATKAVLFPDEATPKADEVQETAGMATPATPAGVAAGDDEVMTVAQACVFMADASASTAEKKAYLAAKGVSPFVIAQAECVAPEDNVQGGGEAPTGVVVSTMPTPMEEGKGDEADTAEAGLAA